MSHRRDIFEFHETVREDLVQMIMNFLNHDLVHEHMAIVGSENDPAGHDFPQIIVTGFTATRDLHENLWHGHRFYISKLEDFLMDNGGSQFVPLPKWDAEQKIPGQFKRIFNIEHPGSATNLPINYDLYNASAAFRPHSPDEVRGENIGNIPSAVQLAGLITPYHFEVHLKLGGVMVHPHYASACALFWIWHAALEEFYHAWMLRKLKNGKGMIAGQNQDGRLEIFIIGNQGDVWRSVQWWRYSGWSYWESLGGHATQLAVERDNLGRLDLFAVGEGGRVEHKVQDADMKTWGSTWTRIGEMNAKTLAVARNQDGRLALFAVDLGGKLWRTEQDAPAQWGSVWTPMGHDKTVKKVTIGRHRSGVLEVYVITADGKPWSMHQTTANGAQWSAWDNLGEVSGGLKQLEVAPGRDGNPLLFGVSLPSSGTTGGIIPGGGIVYNRESAVFYRAAPVRHSAGSGTGAANRAVEEVRSAIGVITGRFRGGAPENPWKNLGLEGVKRIAVGRSVDYRFPEVFAIGPDERLTHSRQQESGAFSGWDSGSIGNDKGVIHVPMKLEELVVVRNERGDPPPIAYGRLPEGTVEVIGKIKDEVTWRRSRDEETDKWSRWRLF